MGYNLLSKVHRLFWLPLKLPMLFLISSLHNLTLTFYQITFAYLINVSCNESITEKKIILCAIFRLFIEENTHTQTHLVNSSIMGSLLYLLRILLYYRFTFSVFHLFSAWERTVCLLQLASWPMITFWKDNHSYSFQMPACFRMDW